jgi:hypothetical protein
VGLCQALLWARVEKVIPPAEAGGSPQLGQRLDMGRQIHSDVYDALRCVEESELEAAPMERLLKISSLAGELSAALNDLFGCRPAEDGGPGSDPALEARMARSEGHLPSE